MRLARCVVNVPLLTLLWGMFASMVLAGPAFALPVTVSLGQGQFTWDYTPDPLAVAAQFNLKCGAATGTYTTTYVIPGETARSQKVSQVVAGPGTYYCVITASNEFGESLPSNEVNFKAGNKPPSPSNLKAQ